MPSISASRVSVERRTGADIAPTYPVMGVVFAAFLVIGMALPVLPLHVHEVLGFGPFLVGLVTGFQFLAALVSRLWAGRLADGRGPRFAVAVGLWLGAASGGLYAASLALLDSPAASVTVLIVGRTLMGGAESLVITGGIAWALGLVDGGRAAKAIAWTGMAMFAALALGAPLGSALFAATTFAGVAVLTIVVSLAALLVVRRVPALVPVAATPQPFGTVMRTVLLPGIGFALSGITFGVMTAFLTLFFALQGWAGGAFAFTAFAVALIAARLAFGHLPDRYGGARVALCSLVVQAVGLALVGCAPSGVTAVVGSAVAGVGFSLVFPSLGLEAVQRTAPEARGMAMGVYNAYLDLTLGIAAPALGLLADTAGIRAVFFAASAAALIGVPVALTLIRKTPATRTSSHRVCCPPHAGTVPKSDAAADFVR